MKTANRKNWSKIEDRQLIEIVKNYEPPYDWEELALRMQQIGYNRNSKQIKSRWNNNLSPNLIKEKWVKTDILKLFLLFDAKNNRWQEIAAQFDGRTDNCIKNQLFSSVRKGLRSIVKELGLETGFSYTAMINQIKPKILANFLLQKISIKTSISSDEIKEATASDLIKTYVFKSKQIYEADPIYERKEVMQAFLQILINMNNEYVHNKKISKMQFDCKSIIEESSAKRTADYLAEKREIAPPIQKQTVQQYEEVEEEPCRPLIADSKLNDTDKVINEFKQALISCELKSSIYEKDSTQIKEQYVSMLKKLGQLSDILIRKLNNMGPFNQEDVEKVRKFISCIHF